MLYYKHVRKLSTRLRDLDSEAQAFAQARLTHERTVRVFANETLEAERFQRVRRLYAARFLCYAVHCVVCTFNSVAKFISYRFVHISYHTPGRGNVTFGVNCRSDLLRD